MSFRLQIPAIFFFLLLPFLAVAQQRIPEVRVQAVGGGKFILVNRVSGRPVSARTYDAIHPFSGGFAVVRIGTKWGFVNSLGVVVQEPQFDELGDFIESST
ncbi:MAG: WG repeat-containing protein, partial [Chitinophagaceae bacterium]